MNKTLLVIRIVFIALCVTASWLVCYSIQEWDSRRGVATVSYTHLTLPTIYSV